MGGMIYCAIICFGVPLAALAAGIWKRNGYVWSFLTGGAVFAVFQLVIRIPLLQNVLPYQDWFIQMQYGTPVIITYLFYAFTAGLFEEAGRFAGFKTLRRGKESWLHGIFFGLGHGGVEAIWVGWQLFNYGAGVSQSNYAVAGFERMCTLVIQTGLTLVVLEGIRKKKLRWLLAAIFLHTAIDLLAPMLVQVSVLASEAAVCLIAIAFIPYILYRRKIWRKGEI